MSARTRGRIVRLALALMFAVILGAAQPPPAARADPFSFPDCYWIRDPLNPPHLKCVPVYVPVEVAPPWVDGCPHCGFAFEMDQEGIRPDEFEIFVERVAFGFSTWSEAALSTDPGQQEQLRNAALDQYTEAAELLGDVQAQVAAYGLADQQTEKLYAVSGAFPEPWVPAPGQWGLQPDSWQWPGLMTDAIANLQAGIADPGQMPQQRTFAAEHLDEAYANVLDILNAGP